MDQQWRANFKRVRGERPPPSKHLATVGKLLAMHFKDEKTKVNADALKLMTSLLRLFVTEAAMRAGRQAESEAVDVVDVAHLEKVLPQLLLDF
ncbi:centromere protein X isoform X1 [Petromyzon marinus]|uniref:Centromere protein X n=1 Tax=Petromyzon marinus TaxID=7757 RepID=A0AAJ7TUD1_PETMA|nr:centromere protein X isoform X1 [Petromyzon marinus]